jgi:hypothetical protein
MVVYILLGLNCFFSFLSLVAILFLSNSLFRVLVPDEPEVQEPPKPEKGLVDPRSVPTYDPRFRS